MCVKNLKKGVYDWKRCMGGRGSCFRSSHPRHFPTKDEYPPGVLLASDWLTMGVHLL